MLGEGAAEVAAYVVQSDALLDFRDRNAANFVCTNALIYEALEAWSDHSNPLDIFLWSKSSVRKNPTEPINERKR